MKNFIGKILLVWAGLMFIITMLIFLPLIWATGFWPEPRRTDLLVRIARGWMAVFYFLCGVRLTIKGRDNFKKGQNYIVVCNHNSMMDVPLTSTGIPGANKTIAKIEMSKIPLFGIIYKRGSVLVDRKSDASRRESYLKMKQVLEAGMHMCIYPEGTRNKTDQPLKAFHDGAFKLAIETGKPLIPTLIFGTRNMLPGKGTLYFRPGRLEMHFLPPVTVQPGDTALTLKEKIFALMKDYYTQHQQPQFV
jgi:1-acyl-sn-glycerol-3-phosphate acyltransferase